MNDLPLPASMPPPMDSAASVAELPADALPRRPRLLVVDDQAVNVQAMYQVFGADHQLFVATSGLQAEKLAHEKQPDLVLLDVVMPDVDGFEVCRRLKSDPITRDIPIIFVTGQNDEAAETRALDVGAVDFITKPINPRIVRARVRTHITLKQHSDRLRRIALVDGLTGLYNRRCLDEVLHRESRRALRTSRPMALLMLDIDHFKRYNDQYGHGAGDVCLQRVAATLATTLTRPGDLAARYGGEEFACVLPETDRAGALAVAAMLEERVRRLHIEHADSPTAPVVTVSIGLATTDTLFSGDTAALLAQADAALYRAKLAGRGRVEAHLPDAAN
jgi:diguanylate cyclase (GGDEF)-like protein